MFFHGRPAQIKHVELRSRVPQELLAAPEGNDQLESLYVKWGNYSDLSPLSGMTRLKSLSLGGASKVTDLSPLTDLTALESLAIDGAFWVKDPSPLSALTGLRELMYGSAYPGTDKTLSAPDLEWLRPLTNLTTLAMPGTRLTAADLSVIAELPRLSQLRLPLRPHYRKQVMDLSASSVAFAEVARAYEEFEAARRLRYSAPS